jgi:hypothetical protein
MIVQKELTEGPGVPAGREICPIRKLQACKRRNRVWLNIIGPSEAPQMRRGECAMTREEALQLLELMKRQQNDEDSIARLEAEQLAKGYVRLTARRRNGKHEEDGKGGPPEEGSGQA